MQDPRDRRRRGPADPAILAVFALGLGLSLLLALRSQVGGDQVNSTHSARPATMAPTIRMPNTAGPSPGSKMA